MRKVCVGCDWTNIAYDLGCPEPSDDEECYKYLVDRLDRPETEDTIRMHLAGLIDNHPDDEIGYELFVWRGLLEIPRGDFAFMRLASPLIRFMWA